MLCATAVTTDRRCLQNRRPFPRILLVVAGSTPSLNGVRFGLIWRSLLRVAPVSAMHCVRSRATNERNKIAAAVDAVLSDDQSAATTPESPTAAAGSPAAAAPPSASPAAAVSSEEAKKADLLKSIDE